jgi:phenylalanyl-tRNA synthetase beta chain
MKLSLTLLKRCIDLPTKDFVELRHVFDDLGLEVEQYVEEAGQPFFKIETLAHRGDHLSAYGIARELSARFLLPVQTPDLFPSWPPVEGHQVAIETECCLRYALLSMDLPLGLSVPKEIQQVMTNYNAQTPAIVHLLNYVLQEIGQPMHAFDADRIEGQIRVVVSHSEEEIVALDGKTYRVPAGSILIQDSAKTVAVGGVIGCANSMVTAQTKRVLVESAAFDPVCVRKTARAMGLSTDASYVFERGSDRDLVITALRRLLALVSGVDSAQLRLSYVPGPERPVHPLALDMYTVRTYLGFPELTQSMLQERLTLLGYKITWRDSETCAIVPPSWREWNVQTILAVIEDFARVYGLNALPQKLPALDYEAPLEHDNERLMRFIEPSLVGQGFCEVITKSYYSHEAVAALKEVEPGIEARHVAVKNSIEKDYSFLKITNCIHFAKLVESNARRNVTSVKVFEFGRLYDRMLTGDRPYQYERDVLSLAVSGRWYDTEWRKPETVEENLLYLKGVLESLIRSAGGAMTVSPSTVPILHPQVQASIVIQGKVCGFFGLLHPKLRERLALEEPMLYAELDVEALLRMCQKLQVAGRFSEYPAVTRDMTLKLPYGVSAGSVADRIRSLHGEPLQQIQIVDSFQKKDESFRRVSYRLLFQSEKRTLERDEVDTAVESILSGLEFERV